MKIKSNPIRTKKDWEAQRLAAELDPGKFHGDIAQREIFWYNKDINAWIKNTPQGWIGYDPKTQEKISVNLPETYEPWERAFSDENPPFYRWFEGGLTNACFNEVDVHVLAGYGDEIAFIFEGDRWELDHQKVSRKELLIEVARRAILLRNIGLKKGDRIILNMPNILEQIYFIEAAKRLGIVYSCVFSGFSAATLLERIIHSGAKAVVTVDGAYKNGQLVSFKSQYIDKALEIQNVPLDVLVVKNATPPDLKWHPERDKWVHELLDDKDLYDLPTKELLERIYEVIPPVIVDAEFPLFIMYTSGSTGKPKGVVHTHGGYVQGIAHTMRVAFDVDPEAKVPDVIYVVADPGWITGQSYMISASLTTRTTSVIIEGSPLVPNASRLSSIIERHKVTIFKAGSTFLKTILSAQENIDDLKKYDCSTLRVGTFCAEPTSPAIQQFAMEVLTPHYINSYWGTEHGGIVLTNFYGNDDKAFRQLARVTPTPNTIPAR